MWSAKRSAAPWASPTLTITLASALRIRIMNWLSGWRPLELADPRSTSTISAGSDRLEPSDSVAAGADKSSSGHSASGKWESRSDCNLMEEIITVGMLDDFDL